MSSSSSSMGSKKVEAFRYPPFIQVHEDGRIERVRQDVFVPPSVDPSTGVSSKDVVIPPKTSVSSKDVELPPESVLSARLYLPKGAKPHSKLPLLIYFHGGGFIIESAFSPTYHNYLNLLVEKTNVVAVSVNYKRAPEYPVPIAYEDSWTAVKWVFSNESGEEWLSNYADFNKVYMSGDSSGANLVHNMAIRAHSEPNDRIKFNGIILVHPYFFGVEPIESEGETDDLGKLWSAVCPATSGPDDPLLNPFKDPNFSKGPFSKEVCKRVLVCVAEKDILIHRGRSYYQELRKSGYDGVVEFMEYDEEHVFHLHTPELENACDFMNRVVAFLSA
ncbi:hypothetical protein IFM89_037984 [Coptis chinensis]|uniref:Alpha/beta hydrolase fold-3 domain-containing protein n=1 Tax=Coptis chinensis TaxID=261450 RepID=A0A835I3Q8_9MAGN|nr:hypothetical protein IFM89_037984 [Coptis chinensis]